MIEVYIIVTNKYEGIVSLVLQFITNTITRGNQHKLINRSFRYDVLFIYALVLLCCLRRLILLLAMACSEGHSDLFNAVCLKCFLLQTCHVLGVLRL